MGEVEWSGPRLAALAIGYRWLAKSGLLLMALVLDVITFFLVNASRSIELGLPLLLYLLGLALFFSLYVVFNTSVYRIATALGSFRVTCLLLSFVAFIIWPIFLIQGVALTLVCRRIFEKHNVECGFLGPSKVQIAALKAQAPSQEHLPL